MAARGKGGAPMSKWKQDALVALQGELKEKLAMTQLCDKLEKPAGGFMSHAEAIRVTELSGDSNQIGQIIKILYGKDDRDFATFCKMLRRSNYGVWATKLELKAETFKNGQGSPSEEQSGAGQGRSSTDGSPSSHDQSPSEDCKAVLKIHPAYDVEIVEAGDYNYLRKAIRNAAKNKRTNPHRVMEILYYNTYHRVVNILEDHGAQYFRNIMNAARSAIIMGFVKRDVRDLDAAHTVSDVLFVLHDDDDWKDTQLLEQIVDYLPEDARSVATSLLDQYNGYLNVFEEEVPVQGLLIKDVEDVAVLEVTKARVEITVDKKLSELTSKDCKEMLKVLLSFWKCPRVEDIVAVKPGSTTVVFLIDKAFTENIIQYAVTPSSLWAFQELRVTRVRVGAFELNVVQLLTQHFKEALRSGLTGGMDFVSATKALPYQVHALVDPDITEKLVIRTINRKIAQPCPEQEELVSGTTDGEGVEPTPEIYEDNVPSKVEEHDDIDKMKDATDSDYLLSRVQELEDELQASELKRMDLTQSNTTLQKRLGCTQQENASLKERLLSVLSSKGGADKDSVPTAPSDGPSKRTPRRWWLKVSAGRCDTSRLPSSRMKQAEGSREMEGEVVFRRDTKPNLLKAVSGTEWMYRRGALERGRQAKLRRHQFTRYHRHWLADNVQKEEGESCKQWLLHLTPDVGTVKEEEEQGLDEGMVKEGATGSVNLKDSEKKRMDLIQENNKLQKILKACREQEGHAHQKIASLNELLSRISSASVSTGDPVAGAMQEAAREGNQSIVQLMVKRFLNVADQALPYQVHALVDPDITEKLVIRTINRKIAQPCPEQEELVSGTTDGEGVEPTPEIYEDNVPSKVEEHDDIDKMKEATDSDYLLPRVQELEDELQASELKRMDLTQSNTTLQKLLGCTQERLLSVLSSKVQKGGADKDSVPTAPSKGPSKRTPRRWWLKVSAGRCDTSRLPSSRMKQAEGSREMEGEVVFRRDTKPNLLKAVSGTEWMYRRGALERGRQASLRQHQFTRYHRHWLADNVQRAEEESCKQWLLHLTPGMDTVREEEEQGLDEGMVKEGATGSVNLKDSEKKRMDLIQENNKLQKILKACREQEGHAHQKIASLEELLSRISSASMSTGDPVAGAMREAAREGNQSIVQLMVKQFLNVADQDGRTPLLLAAEGGHTDLVRLLAEQYEADIFHTMKNSRNALHVAANGGHLPVLQYLCPMFGDKVLDKDSNDESCLDIAEGLGQRTIVEFLTQNCPQLEGKGGGDKDSALTALSDDPSNRPPHRWWLKVSAGRCDTSRLPSSRMKQAEGSREMEGEVVFRWDTKSNMLKAVSGTEWMYRRGALERRKQANLRRHQFTRYHRHWLADNVQKAEEESCKQWLLHSTPGVGTVKEEEEQGLTNQRGNSVQISEKTVAENVMDPSETPEVVYKLIVAVDIGTTYTKVAWSPTVTPPAETEAHLFLEGQWEDQRQVPTAVLYRLSQDRHSTWEFDSFGHEAVLKFREEKQCWALFQTFKMDLNRRMDFDKEVEVRGCTPAGGTVTLPAVRVFCDILVHIKDILLEYIRLSHGQTYAREDIKWVLTVPAMWKASARDVMRQAAREAQIYQKHAPCQLAIALESESAALHIRRLQSRDLLVGSAVDAKRYIIIDIRRSTIEMAVHAVECHVASGKEYVHELEGCIGSANGATVINKKFEDFLCDLDIPGYPKAFTEMRRNPQVWNALMANFESSKVKYNGDAEMEIDMPACIFLQYQKKTKKILKSLVQHKSPRVYITQGYYILHVSPDICLEWYEPTISSTVELVRELHAKHDVEALFVVGGFAKCKILHQRLKKEFPALQLVVPQDPGFAVIQGAVRYGPLKAIASRTSYATYGVDYPRPFRGCDVPSKKIWSEKHHSYYCKDTFSVFVTRGQKLNPAAPYTHTYYPLHLKQTRMAFGIYATDATDPKYVTDHGCVKIGTLSIEIVPLPAGATAADDNRKVTVKMDFSASEIFITADDNTGQYHSEQTVDFLPSRHYYGQ